MSITLQNLKMNNVESKFNSLCTKGNIRSFITLKGHGDGHVQGSGYYVDKKGRKYFIITHDGKYSENMNERYGWLVIMRENGEHVSPIDIKTPDFNHPGSFQILGDHLIVPVENYVYGKKDVVGGCRVLIYNLDKLSNDEAPELCGSTLNIPSKAGHKAGMLGATNEWLAIQDGSELYLYHIDEITEDTKDEAGDVTEDGIVVTSYGSATVKPFQAIGLIAQPPDDNGCKERLFMIGLLSEKDGSTYKDSICLREIVPKKGKNKNSFDCRERGITHVYTDKGYGVGGLAGIHFRYGGGLYLYGDSKKPDTTQMICLGTGRDFNDNRRFNYNEFPSEKKLEIICKQRPLCDQKNRASENFSMKGFQDSKKVKFTIYKNGKEDTERKISFQIYKDVSGGKDKKQYEGDGSDGIIKNGYVKKVLKDSPLYIYSPKPEMDAEIKIVMEVVE